MVDFAQQEAELTAIKAALEAATAFIQGVPAQLQALKDQLANSVTPDQLAPLDAMIDSTKADADALTASLAAATPAAPAPADNSGGTTAPAQ